MVPLDDPRIPACKAALKQVDLAQQSFAQMLENLQQDVRVRAVLHVADTMRAPPPSPSFPFTVGLLMRLARDGAASTSDAQTALAEIEGRL